MTALETTMYLSTTSLGQTNFAHKIGSAALDVFLTLISYFMTVRHGHGAGFV
jgi:hypothetical protein